MPHVEQGFFPHWQRFQRCIKQRNNLLRRDKIPDKELSVWTQDLAKAGTAINDYRAAYFEQLAPRFQAIMGTLSPGLTGWKAVRFCWRCRKWLPSSSSM